MSEDQLFIGIDSGTQGTKAVVLSRENGKILSTAYAPHSLIENNAGRREQEPAWWIAACRSAISQCLEATDVSRKQVRAIGVSGQQHGMVPLDKEGNVIRPAKLWCDTETGPQSEAITRRIGGPENAIEMMGNAVAVGFTASKILWMKENEPDNYARLTTVLLPHDYINYWLTGERKTEYGDASGTAYFDIRNRSWSEPVLQAIDDSGKLAACLPELIRSEAPVGTLLPEIADEFGFRPDVIVSSGGGDNMIAAIGTGNVSPGVVTASLGTSGTIYACTDQPVIDPNGELAAFCSSTGSWLPLVCTMNVTVSTELTRALLGMDVPAMNLCASAAPVGAEGIMLLPYFNGERTPALPNATASLFGLSSVNWSRENLCRAAMEGPTLGLRYGLDVLKRQGIAPEQIRLVGGGSQSGLWREIVADIFDCPVVCPEISEAGALGGAIQALWCFAHEKEGGASLDNITGEFVILDASTRVEPQQDRVSQYAEIYQRYLQLNDAMTPLF
ncbi:MAG: xylulokinase [Desulfobacterales bacterium]